MILVCGGLADGVTELVCSRLQDCGYPYRLLDLARFPEAQACYREALRLNPFYADAHFYLAVTFEKMGLSQEARPHWRAYQQLAPQGEWVELAKEFSE